MLYRIKNIKKAKLFFMKDSLAGGALILIFSSLVCKVLGAVYRIPLSNILGAEGVGIYQMIFPIYSLAIIICSSGVVSSLSKSIAVAKAQNNSTSKIVKKAFLFSLFSSLFIALILVVFSKNIATLQGSALGTDGYKICALALIFSSLVGVFRGYFQGEQNMLPTALSQIIEQISKVVFGLVFAFLFSQNGISSGVVGAFLGILISEICALLYVGIKFFLTKKHSKKIISIKKLSPEHQDKFMSQSFRFMLSFLIIPLITVIDSFVVINLISKNFTTSHATALYGLQSGMVNSLINFPVIISLSLSMVLLPSLSGLFAVKNNLQATEKIRSIFSALWIFILPCLVVFACIAPVIIQFLYPSLEPYYSQICSSLLRVSTVQILLISVLQICVSIFQSMGKESLPIYIMLISGIVKILLMFLLVGNSEINIFGLAISNLVFYALSATISIFFLKKHFSFSLDLRLLCVSFGAGVFLFVFCLYVNVLNLVALAKLVLVFFGVIILYFLPLIVFKIINLREIKNIIKQKLITRSEK